METTPRRVHPGIARLSATVIIFLLLLTLPSCYTVRLTNKEGKAVPDLSNMEPGFFRHQEVHRVDTTVCLSFTQGKFELIQPCSSGGFHSIEYKVALGHVLLSTITLGRVKKVKLRYTCLHTENGTEP